VAPLQHQPTRHPAAGRRAATGRFTRYTQPVGAETHPPRSCNHAVFMDEAALDVGSLEVRAVGLTGRIRSGVAGGRCLLAEGLVRTVPVVVLDVLAEHVHSAVPVAPRGGAPGQVALGPGQQDELARTSRGHQPAETSGKPSD
jgi:hypothetical protein